MPDISPVYRQRNPETSQYYKCVEDHLETFEQVYDDRFPKQYGFLRPYVKNVIYRYLDCGILKNGFASIRCFLKERLPGNLLICTAPGGIRVLMCFMAKESSP